MTSDTPPEHHALLICGSETWAFATLPEAFRVPGADVLHLRGSRMGIDEVRTLIREAHVTPLTNVPARVCVLAFRDYTTEAQNALLKLCEEPPRTTRIYLLAQKTTVLLPTLRSRLVLLAEEGESESDVYTDFFASSIGDRLACIATRVDKKDDAWMHGLMRAFESHAARTKQLDFMRAVVELRPVFSTPGASKKMILEHLALMC